MQGLIAACKEHVHSESTHLNSKIVPSAPCTLTFDLTVESSLPVAKGCPVRSESSATIGNTTVTLWSLNIYIMSVWTC